ncbi:MAG TPA: hypothetical protein VII92_04405 [Anaerolineae bacterium]
MIITIDTNALFSKAKAIYAREVTSARIAQAQALARSTQGKVMSHSTSAIKATARRVEAIAAKVAR